MMGYKTNLFAMLVVAVLASVWVAGERPLMAQANDPLIGTWVLDNAKSDFGGQTNFLGTTSAPDKRTMKFERVPEGMRHSTETVDMSGFSAEIYRLQYTFNIDGKRPSLLMK